MKEILLSVADDIERQGHYRNQPDQTLYSQSPERSDGQCCLIVSPTIAALSDDWTLRDEAFREMRRRTRAAGYHGLADFSDVEPTERVLELLRADG